MRPYPYHDQEAHQRSIEIQRKIKRTIFKGHEIDWRSIPAIDDDDDEGPHIDAFSGSPLSSCNTFETILDDFRLPKAATTSASDAGASGESFIVDMIC